MVPYVDTVTVMRVLLFVLHVWMLRECDGARLMAMLVWGMDEGVVVMNTGHVGGTCGLGIVSSAADVLWISVVRGMRGIGGVCVWLGVEKWVSG